MEDYEKILYGEDSDMDFETNDNDREDDDIWNKELDNFEQAYFDTPHDCKNFAQALKEYYQAHPQEPKKPRGIAESTFIKIGEQLGSNPGGWYQDSLTHEKYYIKFYEDPDRARIEFIANKIYEKLGIRVPESSLQKTGNTVSLFSKEIPNAQATYREDQTQSQDVRNGFVADAYLANWDVVGLVYDNIVKNESGMWRIDNGGSMVFRAQGEKKEFFPDDIPELETMRNPKYPAGKVFAGITEEDMREQAQQLIRTIHTEDIIAIVTESGITGELKETLINTLKRRRKFLQEKFMSAAERIPVSIEKLEEQKEKLKTIHLRPRVCLLADSDKIENQEVDIIDAKDKNRYEVNFKLTASHYAALMARIKEKFTCGTDFIYYSGVATGERDTFEFAHALTVQHNEITIKVANDTGWRSALGLVHIEIPTDENSDSREIGKKLNNIFTDVLEIEGGLSSPDQEAERQYKKARYAWHHKTPSEAVPENIENRLTRQEVFPSYFTFVETDKYKEYQAISPFAVYHDLQSIQTLPSIIKAGGLISTHERYRRGLLYNGSSSITDLEGGGGDSVFVRILTREGVQKNQEENDTIFGIKFVCNPAILDRTDWYAYDTDRFGKTGDTDFYKRKSPKELFENQKKNGFNPANEEMFRLGISIQDICALACDNPKKMISVRELLRAEGIEKINGRLVEEWIILAHTYTDLIAISHGAENPNIKNLAQWIKENPEDADELRKELIN